MSTPLRNFTEDGQVSQLAAGQITASKGQGRGKGNTRRPVGAAPAGACCLQVQPKRRRRLIQQVPADAREHPHWRLHRDELADLPLDGGCFKTTVWFGAMTLIPLRTTSASLQISFALVHVAALTTWSSFIESRRASSWLPVCRFLTPAPWCLVLTSPPCYFSVRVRCRLQTLVAWSCDEDEFLSQLRPKAAPSGRGRNQTRILMLGRGTARQLDDVRCMEPSIHCVQLLRR